VNQRAVRQIEVTLAGLAMPANDGWACVGATFRDGARFGSGFVVPKIFATASAGRKLA
jgi:hypothetical protein